jgi:hypothetical protein
MKTIKVITDSPVKEAKIIGKPVEIMGETFACVNYPAQYMNASEPVYVRRVVHVKTGMCIPIFNMPSKAPAKDFLTEANHFLNNIGLNIVQNEVKRFETINP